MHVLFSDFEDIENKDVIPTVNQISPEISKAAVIAAENFVETCCQHCLFLSGKGVLNSEIKRYSEGRDAFWLWFVYDFNCVGDFDDSLINNAAYTLLQSGKVLDLSTMLKNKKYQNRGQKEGAVKAMKKLEADGFGVLKKKEMHRGTSAVSHI